MVKSKKGRNINDKANYTHSHTKMEDKEERGGKFKRTEVTQANTHRHTHKDQYFIIQLSQQLIRNHENNSLSKTFFLLLKAREKQASHVCSNTWFLDTWFFFFFFKPLFFRNVFVRLLRHFIGSVHWLFSYTFNKK